MGYKLPRFLKFEGFETIDLREFLHKRRIEIVLRNKSEEMSCSRCGTEMKIHRGKHRMRLETLPILGNRTYIHLWRRKGHCENCKKARSEKIELISKDSPHLTQEYSWWLGRMMEFAPVSRTAEHAGLDDMTLWRLDLHRMQRMQEHYKIPDVKKICVDEVYARRRARYRGESRNKKFFTVISDLETRRVIWVSETRNQSALDEFFHIIGEKAAKEIEVVAMDQHDDYMKSVRENAPNATIVWDKFHIMMNFEEVVNEERKMLHNELARKSDLAKYTAGKHRYIFLKRDSKRTREEKEHINEVIRRNERFAKLEIIKERMLSFFSSQSLEEARLVLQDIGDWAWQAGFQSLKKWHRNMERGWDTLKNYFFNPVTNALAEGHNHVIKTLKRKAFGYRNMTYFRLKIMQVCGYLNSKYVPMEF